jgi:DNA-binding Xre family transcriptional regulator
MIKYDKLFALLEAQGKSAVYFLRKEGIHPTTMNKLRKNERVNTDTIDRLCEKLDCQPGDIMEYVKE